MVEDSLLLSSLSLFREVLQMTKVSVGELVKWRYPQEPMYSYGVVKGFRDMFVVVECRDYYAGLIVEVHKKCIRKVKGGGKAVGGNKEYSK